MLKRKSESGTRPVAWGAKQFQSRYFTKIIIMSLGLLSLTTAPKSLLQMDFKMSINLLTPQSLVNLWILHCVSVDDRMITLVLHNFKQTAFSLPHPVGLGAAGTAVVHRSTVPHKITVKAGRARWLRLQPLHIL